MEADAPVVFVRLPEPVSEPANRLKFAMFSDPFVMLSNPVVVVLFSRLVVPADLFMVRL